jgi:predicted MFS family arabinose efflux permease
LGIVLAGLLVLAGAGASLPPAVAWLLLGLLAFAVAAASWRVPDSSAQASPTPASPVGLSRTEWALVLAYGGYGFGYIIPATFLPAMARALVADPFVFGWAWPFFGVAGAASTVVVTRYLHAVAPRTVAIWSLLIMAAGVLAPAVSSSFAAIVVAALCVGSTFVVMTLVGFQDARRIAQGPPARLIAAMTAAFAVGQLLGPPLVALASGQGNAILVPSLVATGVLLACALTLAVGPGALASKAD